MKRSCRWSRCCNSRCRGTASCCLAFGSPRSIARISTTRPSPTRCSPGCTPNTPMHPSSPLPTAIELSLIVPVYNERENLPELISEIRSALDPTPWAERYEVVAVDDGSPDGSLEVLKTLKRDHPLLHIVAFAANAGQTAAFAAGFRAARGRICVTLDADLQNAPAAGAPVRPRPRRHGTTKYGMWNRVFRALADAFAVRWMQRRALRYRVTE